MSVWAGVLRTLRYTLTDAVRLPEGHPLGGTLEYTLTDVVRPLRKRHVLMSILEYKQMNKQRLLAGCFLRYHESGPFYIDAGGGSVMDCCKVVSMAAVFLEWGRKVRGCPLAIEQERTVCIFRMNPIY